MAVRAATNNAPASGPLQQNPQADFMDSFMDNPLTQSLLQDPAFIQNMMQNNPQTQRLLETNPELRQVLNDPETVRQMMETIRNPNLRREMMRNTDRIMANVENMPGGFDAMRRVYQNVQEPLMDAFDQPETLNDTASTRTDDTNINTQPLPNPWAQSASLLSLILVC